jgi:hypothetical protein
MEYDTQKPCPHIDPLPSRKRKRSLESNPQSPEGLPVKTISNQIHDIEFKLDHLIFLVQRLVALQSEQLDATRAALRAQQGSKDDQPAVSDAHEILTQPTEDMRGKCAPKSSIELAVTMNKSEFLIVKPHLGKCHTLFPAPTLLGDDALTWMGGSVLDAQSQELALHDGGGDQNRGFSTLAEGRGRLINDIMFLVRPLLMCGLRESKLRLSLMADPRRGSRLVR